MGQEEQFSEKERSLASLGNVGSVGERRKDSCGEADGEKKPLPPLTRDKKRLLVMLCIVQIACYLMFGVIAPFFPVEAASKGATLTQIGLIFGCYQIVVFVSSPIMGKYISTIGPKFLYLSGLFVRGVADILFGTLNRAPDGRIFVAMCFVCRMTEGLGTAAFVTAAWAIVAKEYPDRVSVIFGLLLTFNAIGLMLGPPIGGLLYDLGGFPLPFYVLGGGVLLVGFVNIFTFPDMSESPSKAESEQKDVGRKKGVMELLMIPRVVINVIVMMFMWIPRTFTDVNLEQHLVPFGLSSSEVGLMFMIGTTAVAASNSVWGWLANKHFMPRLQILFGCVTNVIGCLLLGPTPLLPFLNTSLWLIAIALVFLGIAGTACSVAGFKDCIVQAHSHGFPESLATYGLISGVYQFCASFGAFAGPTFGNIIVEALDFAWALTIVGLVQAALVLLVIVSKLAEVCHQRRENRQSNGSPGETQALIPSERRRKSGYNTASNNYTRTISCTETAT